MIQCRRCKNNIEGKLNSHLVNALKNIDKQQTIHSTQTPRQQSLPTLISAKNLQIKDNNVLGYNGRYPTHAHNHITRAVAAMDSCFAPLVANQYGIAIARSWYVCFSAFFEHFNQPGHSIADKELMPLELQPTFSVSAVRQEKRTS